MASLRTGGSTRPPANSSPGTPNTTQQVVSLLLVLHLFCVVVALSSYTRRSPLQARLLDLLAPYTRTLNIAPSVAPYHLSQYDALTGDNPEDDEHYLELEYAAADGSRQFLDLSRAAFPLPDARRRYRSLASEMAYSVADEGGSNRLAELARAAAGYAMREAEVDAAVLRLRHHLSQPRKLEDVREGFPSDPLARQYIVTPYEADVLLDEDGEVQLIKREDRSQVAPPVPAASPSVKKDAKS